MKNPIRGPKYGLVILYSPMHLAYLLCWFDQVLRIINDRSEAISLFEEWTEATDLAVAKMEAEEAAAN